jgi:hypothetical protein
MQYRYCYFITGKPYRGPCWIFKDWSRSRNFVAIRLRRPVPWKWSRYLLIRYNSSIRYIWTEIIVTKLQKRFCYINYGARFLAAFTWIPSLFEILWQSVLLYTTVLLQYVLIIIYHWIFVCKNWGQIFFCLSFQNWQLFKFLHNFYVLSLVYR